LRVVSEDSLAAKESLEGVPVHSQMPFNGNGGSLNQSARQDTLEIRLHRVPVDEDNNRPQTSLKCQCHFRAGGSQTVEVAVINNGRFRDQTARL
jgi:hypothetical protein